MPTFRARPVLPEYRSIGDQLRLARKQFNLSLEEASRYLKEKPAVLKALEDEDYQNLPKGIYGKIAFKKYLVFLGLDYRQIMKNFVKDRRLAEKLRGSDVFLNQKVSQKDLLIFPKFLKNILLAIVIVSAFVYLVFYLNRIFSAPSLEIIYPSGDLVISENYIKIEGRVAKEATVEINGELILTDKAGYFSQEVDLKQGLNDITIRARQKYGQENILNRRIIVQ